jgi:K+-transporting ATPase ATPase C chain
MNARLRVFGAALRAFLVLTVILGIAYPLLMTGIAQAGFSDKADGSAVTYQGKDVGSSLIGQTFDLPGQPGTPDPKWFQPRPSAAGTGYDAQSSGASNLGPENADLIELVKTRKTQVAQFNGVDESKVPADAVTASGSGLDPHISPAYARIQIDRIARERQLAVDKVTDLVDKHTQSRVLGILGEERVNVLELNIALAKL